jgi:DNA-binding response OmpR family regulator
VLDIDARRVTTAERENMPLTAIEFRLLRYLLMNPDRILSKTELSEHIYEEEQLKDSNVIEVYVNRLRSLLGKSRITTYRGQGYRLTN